MSNLSTHTNKKKILPLDNMMGATFVFVVDVAVAVVVVMPLMFATPHACRSSVDMIRACRCMVLVTTKKWRRRAGARARSKKVKGLCEYGGERVLGYTQVLAHTDTGQDFVLSDGS